MPTLVEIGPSNASQGQHRMIQSRHIIIRIALLYNEINSGQSKLFKYTKYIYIYVFMCQSSQSEKSRSFLSATAILTTKSIRNI